MVIPCRTIRNDPLHLMCKAVLCQLDWPMYDTTWLLGFFLLSLARVNAKVHNLRESRDPCPIFRCRGLAFDR